MIVIDSKRKKWENILKKYPDAIIADVTSHAEDDLIKLSPFYFILMVAYLCHLARVLQLHVLVVVLLCHVGPCHQAKRKR